MNKIKIEDLASFKHYFVVYTVINKRTGDRWLWVIYREIYRYRDANKHLRWGHKSDKAFCFGNADLSKLYGQHIYRALMEAWLNE